MSIGDTVVAIGTPISTELAGTVTCGTVSGLERTVRTNTIPQIQTTAPINPGNSGGPLYNAYGEVVGIVTTKLSGQDAENISFATPISGVLPYINEVITCDREHGAESESVCESVQETCGFIVKEITEEESALYRIPSGLIVCYLDEGSPAYLAGVRRGDILMSVNGIPLTSTEEFSAWECGLVRGEHVVLTLYNGTTTVELSYDIAMAEPYEDEADSAS